MNTRLGLLCECRLVILPRLVKGRTGLMDAYGGGLLRWAWTQNSTLTSFVRMFLACARVSFSEAGGQPELANGVKADSWFCPHHSSIIVVLGRWPSFSRCSRHHCSCDRADHCVGEFSGQEVDFIRAGCAPGPLHP